MILCLSMICYMNMERRFWNKSLLLIVILLKLTCMLKSSYKKPLALMSKTLIQEVFENIFSKRKVSETGCDRSDR